jgi:L-arabinonolactonase
MGGNLVAELLLDCRNSHGEGVIWSADHDLLMWTDIHGLAFWTLDPATGVSKSHVLPERLCCFASRAGRAWNEIVAAFASGFALFDVLTGRRQQITPFEPELPTTRLNDGRTDRAGRFVAGGMDEGDPMSPISSVWVLGHDLTTRRLFEGVACANSISFSPDGATMYFADSPTSAIVAYDYDTAAGTIGSKRTVVKTNGVPDGSCVDAEGYLWNAVWEGYRVERYDPDGRLDRVIEVPVSKPTCCEFGGAGLDTLYITTSRLGSAPALLEEEPQAGGLFACRVGVRGHASRPFG